MRLMEAMSCEVPTIGTAAGGVAELINDGVDGVLVPPKDPAALAALDRDVPHAIKITGLDPIGAYVIWTSEDGAGFTFSTPLNPITVRSLVTKSLYARLSRRLTGTRRGPDELGTLPPFPFEE